MNGFGKRESPSVRGFSSAIYNYASKKPPTIVGGASLKNIKENELNNVKAYNIAAGLKNENKNLYIEPQSNFLSASLIFDTKNIKSKKNKIVEKILVRNISKIPEIKSLKKIDLIKIDTEGSESEIVFSLNDILYKTQNIIIEYHTAINNSKNSLDRIFNILKQEHFTINVFGEFRGGAYQGHTFMISATKPNA